MVYGLLSHLKIYVRHHVRRVTTSNLGKTAGAMFAIQTETFFLVSWSQLKGNGRAFLALLLVDLRLQHVSQVDLVVDGGLLRYIYV